MIVVLGKLGGGSIWNPIMTWVFNFGFLIGIYMYEPTFEKIASSLKVLDNTRVLLPWTTYFKISMLKLIAFNMDYYWMRNSANKKTLPLVNDEEEDKSKAKDIVSTSHGEEDYSYWNFLAYITYLPLYIAGPILGFNAFLAQIYHPQRNLSLRTVLFLFVKVLGYNLLLDYGLHYIYYYNFSQNNVWMSEFCGVELLITAFWVIIFMYLKFLCIWRFFRVISLLDGVDPPENMLRCVCNNFTFTGFWR